ncbi:MAG: ABC transporter permease [Bryobacteraceae bacterium]
MATLVGDLRFALRSLRANPAFTAIAVASLALGIGANTAIFSLVDQLLLWAVPAREPGRLARLEGGRSGTYPFYREYRARNQVFSGLFAASDPVVAGIRPEGAAAVEVGRVSYVSGDFFGTLGVGAAAGRVIADPDDAPSGSPVAVLAYDYWQRRFAGDLRVLGRKLAVNGYPLVIVGVAEAGFGGLSPIARPSAFVPLSAYPLTTPGATAMWNTPGMFWLTEIGRLKPGMSLGHAQAALRVLWPQVVDAVNEGAARNGKRPRKYDKEAPVTLAAAAHGTAGGPSGTMDPLAALFFATGLVLLIACANVANLLLARANGRRREMALRAALGATRGRLVRQLFTESLLLAGLGGALALAVAWAAVMGLAKANLVDAELRFHPSLAVAGFSLGATLLTGLLFGLAPAMRASRLGLAEAIKDGGSATAGGSRLRLGKAVIALQVALSLALLVGAGLFLRTLRNLNHADIGFQKQNVVLFDVDPSKLGYKDHRLREFYDGLLAHARATTGVRSAALSLMTPMGEWAFSTSISAEGYQPAPGEQMIILANRVTEGYFTTLGIPMLLGRDFRAEDEPAVTPGGNLLAALGRMSGGFSDTVASGSHVCIIDESLARHFFGTANPIGRHVSFEDKYDPAGAIEIVGVVKDVHHMGVRRADLHGMIYTPSWSKGAEARMLSVRLAGDAAPAIAAIRRQVHEMDANVPVLRTRKLEEYVNASFERERLIAYLCAVFGALALGLASVGLYGVMAYAVTQRTKEIGVRIALGAQRGDVIGMVLRESLLPVLAGLAAGVAGALALARLVAGMLYGVAPRDPVTIVLAAVAMMGVSLAAAAIPARRASRVEPMTALRHE